MLFDYLGNYSHFVGVFNCASRLYLANDVYVKADNVIAGCSFFYTGINKLEWLNTMTLCNDKDLKIQ